MYIDLVEEAIPATLTMGHIVLFSSTALFIIHARIVFCQQFWLNVSWKMYRIGLRFIHLAWESSYDEVFADKQI